MSKLSLVRQALEHNPRVLIGKVMEKNHLPRRDGYWSHTVDFLVAPHGGLYTAAELQEFMMSLVPQGLETTCLDSFHDYPDLSAMNFGKLYFDEDIGNEEITRVCTITDPDLLNEGGFVNGKRTIQEEKPYQRRTWIRPFPNLKIIKDALEGKLRSEYYIDREDLERYKSKSPKPVSIGFFRKLFSS